ncbi:hypothetical protein CK203_012513 [Vitis vinifera]|uniref:Retroviral polymerase SH3-like domain-containing protein n=1 Tax=Vitis vinifera TaxID=29760 RepID=A0A438KMZ0_VITVI|nr:hypothetical protein CK203_012513 [Vitis vinifera]
MFMRMTIANNIKTSFPQTKSASKFLKSVEERFKRADKSLAGTLMAELTTMKYDGQKGIQQHILNMTEKAAKLKALGMSMDESFLVQFILNSLPSQFAPFKIHYNTKSDQWNLNELTSKRIQEEKGHVKKDCNKRKAWFKKRDDLSRYGYVYLMHEKSHAIDIFEMFITKVERQLDKKIKIVRSDRCGEYYGRYDELGQNPSPFAKFLEKRGIRAQYTMPVETIIYNPHEKKLDSRTISGYFIGYPDKSKRYRFYCPNHSVRIIETGNAIFLENGEISESNEPRKVDIKEIRMDIPPLFLPQEIIAPQPAQQVEEHEQHNRDGSLPRENIAIENVVEPPQPEPLRRSPK